MLNFQNQQNSPVSSHANVILAKIQAGDNADDILRDIEERQDSFELGDINALIFNCVSNGKYIKILEKALQLYFERNHPIDQECYTFLRDVVFNIVSSNNLSALELIHEKLAEFECLDGVAEYIGHYQDASIVKVALKTRNAAILKFFIENFSVSSEAFCNFLLLKDDAELLSCELRLYKQQVSLFKYLLENTIAALIERAHALRDEQVENTEEDSYALRQFDRQVIIDFFQKHDHLLRTVINTLHVEAAKLLLDAKESLPIFTRHNGEYVDLRLVELINPLVDEMIMEHLFPFNQFSRQIAKFFFQRYPNMPENSQEPYKEMLAVLLDNHCFLGVSKTDIPEIEALNLKGGGLAWSGEPVNESSFLQLIYKNTFFDQKQDIQAGERKHLEELLKYITGRMEDDDYIRLLQVRLQQAIEVEETRSNIQDVARRQDYLEDLKYVLKFIKRNLRRSLKETIIAKLNTPSFFSSVVEQSSKDYFNNDGSFAIPVELQELIPDARRKADEDDDIGSEENVLPNEEAVAVLRQRVEDIRKLAHGLKGPKQRKEYLENFLGVIIAFTCLLSGMFIPLDETAMGFDDDAQTVFTVSSMLLIMFILTKCGLCCWSGYSQWPVENMFLAGWNKFVNLADLIYLEKQYENPFYAELKDVIEILFKIGKEPDGEVVGELNGKQIKSTNKDLAYVLNIYADELEKIVNDLAETDLPFKAINHRMKDSFKIEEVSIDMPDEEMEEEIEYDELELVTLNSEEEIEVEEVDGLLQPLLPSSQRR